MLWGGGSISSSSSINISSFDVGCGGNSSSRSIRDGVVGMVVVLLVLVVVVLVFVVVLVVVVVVMGVVGWW